MLRNFEQKGFTTVELMIVVMIIGILAAIALPTYKTYSARAKVAELLVALSACRAAVTEAYGDRATPTAAANSWGCESTTAASKYVASVSTDEDGGITVTAQNIGSTIDGNAITLFPADSNGVKITYSGATSINRWVCGGQGTTIPANYLPPSCRGY